VFQPRHVQSGVYKSRREIPRGSDAMGVEPVGDCFRAVAAREMVNVGSLASRSFLGSSQEMLPVLRLKSMAEVAQKRLYFVRGLLQMRGRSARRCRRIVQFVGQTRCHRAERNQLFPLLGV